jgi:hypothetical protein
MLVASKLRAAVATPLSYQRRARCEVAAQLLCRHLFAEELAVHSVVAGVGDRRAGDALIEGERELVRTVARALRWARLWPFARRPLRRVETIALRHFAMVEDVVLPLLVASQREEKLHMMGSWYEQARRAAPTRPHPHAPRRVVPLLALTPAVAVIDRVRDRLAGI